jgi:hypothetical protein
VACFPGKMELHFVVAGGEMKNANLTNPIKEINNGKRRQ